MRESLDDKLRYLLPWDIDLVIDEPVDVLCGCSRLKRIYSFQ